MRLLVITNEFPLPLDRGGPVRCYGLARALAQEHEVRLLALRRPTTTQELVEQMTSVVSTVEVFEPGGSGTGWPRALRRGVPPWIAAQHSLALERRAAELAPEVDGVVVLDDFAGVYAPALAAAAPVVCDKHNVMGASAAAPATGARAQVHRAASIHLSRRFEQSYLAAAAGVVVTSEEEAERLLSLYGRRPEAVVPSAVDIPESPVEPDGQRAIGWLGTHQYDVNVEGLVRFVEEGWDELGRDGFRLLVAGGGAPAEVLALERHPGVEILGYVEQLDDLFSRIGAAVVPLWRGAGVKLKTLTFMAAGVPVAGTPVAMEGIEAEHGHHCLVAEDPAGLAEAARALVEDAATARRIGAEGRRLVAETYSWSAAGARFREVVERTATARS